MDISVDADDAELAPRHVGALPLGLWLPPKCGSAYKYVQLRLPPLYLKYQYQVRYSYYTDAVYGEHLGSCIATFG